MQNPLSSHLEKIKQNSRSTVEEGLAFERIVKDYLENDKLETQHYDKVWFYKHWAAERGLATHDTGVDLVARHRGTQEFCVIQCKFHASDKTLSISDLSTFLAKANMPNIKSLMIVDTTLGELSRNLLTSLKETGKDWRRIKIYDLERSNIDWEAYFEEPPEDGKVKLIEPKKPRTHQAEAIEAVKAGLADTDRGKMIMACGTGKTLTALRLAEDMGGAGKVVLYLVPSLALMSQTVREWKNDAYDDFLAFSVCSDSKVGKREQEGDAIHYTIHDLAIPATTNAQQISEEIENAPRDQMIVVFSTYQSIDIVVQAQAGSMPEFDLIICDEAHRTATARHSTLQDKPFMRIHDNAQVKGKKRLYMTATPKIFGENAKATAEKHDIVVASMDDETLFGEELYELSFSEAVEQKLLSDYKVIVLAMDEGLVSASLQNRLASSGLIKLDEMTKIVGCYKALTKRDIKKDTPGDAGPMNRAVAFCQSLDLSEVIADQFDGIVEDYLASEQNKTPGEKRLHIESEQVRGTYNAKLRESRLDWLREKTEDDTCRILTNVRCLSEGVDVPALDAVIFMHPRKSQIDVVQAVGRVMRRAPGKKMGYVILPVVISAGADAARALENDDSYRVIWQILNALRTHDERFDAIINQISLGQDVSDKLEILGVVGDLDGKESNSDSVDIPDVVGAQIPFDFDEFHEAIRAQIMKKCGTRPYWDAWAHKVARIAEIHITRITQIVASPGPEQTAFLAFLKEIKADLNDSITQSDAIEMLAQHLITKPVFDTLFKDSVFTKNNAVSKAMEVVLEKLGHHNLEKETKSLTKFYASVQRDAEGIDAAGRQTLVKNLYQEFFNKAFKETTQRLGIIYTPPEVVDFIIHSVNDVLKSEFGKTLGAKGVHILDPFTGTGTFITQLLLSGLIKPEELEHKYKNEIHANEIVLLAYYIAAINIESLYHALMAEADGVEPPYAPFSKIVLTDTFQMREEGEGFSAKLLDENSEKRKEQRELDIQVIMGNPPYSVGQKSQNDNAENIKYPNLDKAITDTYAKHSKATLKSSLYDSYIRAFRWASDRLKTKGNDAGVIAYVSNAGWVDSNSADGLRKCLAEEFSSLYIFHLRGNINKNISSRGTAKEGDNIFGMGSKAGIAISVLVRNPDDKEQGKIYFHDIGDDLKIEQKQAIIKGFKSIDGITAQDGWQDIKPNETNDWINQRDPSFANHISIGDKKNKTATNIFLNYSMGVSTNRDYWTYNASNKTLEENMREMIEFYNAEAIRLKGIDIKEVKNTAKYDSKKISWTDIVLKGAQKGIIENFDNGIIMNSAYRPFEKRWFYYSAFFNQRRYQMPKIFPRAGTDNLVIACNASWNGIGQIAIMSNTIVDLHFNGDAQCFPLKLYEVPNSEDLLDSKTTDYTPRDGISDAGLKHFQALYPKDKISKEDLFYYIYGLLHSPDYLRKFKNNLPKELPRIPAVKSAADFWKFSKAGRALGDLHVNYESAEPYRIEIKEGDLDLASIEDPAKFFRVKKMGFGKINGKKHKSIVEYNKNITIINIPPEAYEYIINGKSALEWVMDRQGKKIDKKKSGITNDANDYATETMNDAAYPLKLFQRVLTVSLETMKIVNALPPLDID